MSLDNGDLLIASVVIRLRRYYRRLLEVMRGGRRTGFPLQSRGLPWIRSGNLAIAHGPQQVNRRQERTDRQDRSARAGEHIQHLEPARIRKKAARHSQTPKDELREDGKSEADSGNQPSELG